MKRERNQTTGIWLEEERAGGREIRPSEFRAHTQGPTTTNADTLEWHSPTYTWLPIQLQKLCTHTHLHTQVSYSIRVEFPLFLVSSIGKTDYHPMADSAGYASYLPHSYNEN